MKLTVDVKLFTYALKKVITAINPNSTMPILSSVLMEIKTIEGSSVAFLTATDLSITIKAVYNFSENLDDFSVCIEPNDIINLFSTLAFETVDIEFEPGKMKIIAGLGDEFDLPTYNAEEYPISSFSKIMTEITPYKINMADLFDHLKVSLPFTGKDPLRPVMNGIYIEQEGDEITLTATDAQKLVTSTVTLPESSLEKTDYILPKESLKSLKHIASDVDVSVYNAEKMIVFQSKTVSIGITKIEGRFPQYKSVIPQESTYQLKASTKEMSSAIKAVLLFGNKAVNSIMLTFTASSAIISAQDIDGNKKGHKTIEIESNVEEQMQVGFNGLALGLILDNVSENEFTLEGTASNRAHTISIEKDNLSRTFLIMPIMLNT